MIYNDFSFYMCRVLLLYYIISNNNNVILRGKVPTLHYLLLLVETTQITRVTGRPWAIYKEIFFFFSTFSTDSFIIIIIIIIRGIIRCYYRRWTSVGRVHRIDDGEKCTES